MDFITLGIGSATIVAIPLGAAVRKSYTNESRISKLEANYLNLSERLTEMRDEQKNQTTKLDQLINRFL